MSYEDLRLNISLSQVFLLFPGKQRQLLPGAGHTSLIPPIIFSVSGMAHGLDSWPSILVSILMRHAVIDIGDVDVKIKTPLESKGRGIANLEGLTFDTKPGQVTLPRTKMRLSDPKNFPPDPVPAYNLGG